jgi:hypothetical protein
MPAVVDFIADVGGGVIDVVSDVGGAIVDVVGNTIEAVGDVVQDVGEAVVNTVKYVAENPEVAIIAIAAPQLLPAIGVPAIAVQPVTAALVSASQGGDLEDIGKAAVGSFVGQGVGTAVASKVGTAIGASGNTAQTALANAVGGATGSAAGAAATGGDVGEAALLGGLGSGSASLARSGATSLANTSPSSATADIAADVGEALGRTAVSGNLSGELTGAALGTLAREGDIAMQQLRQPTTKTGGDQVVEAFSQPKSPGVGKQLGSALAQADTGTRTDVLPEVQVTAEPEMRFDVRTGRRIPVITPSKPAAATRPPEQMTGRELVERAATPEESPRLPEVTVEGEREQRLPEVVVEGEFEEDVRTRLPNVDVTGDMQVEEQPLALDKVSDEELLAAIEESFKPMDVRIARVAGRRGTAPMSVSPRAVGTSPTAAIVGQKEPVFGGEEDAQQDVWNSRSLRLRKALG